MCASGFSIKNIEADTAFRSLAFQLRIDVNSRWVGGYADHVQKNDRHLFEAYFSPIMGKSILEFGCNFGASAIVMAMMGGLITAIDISSSCVELAKLNAKRYGVEDKIRFVHVRDTTNMPFESGSFDLVSCCSVFEYIDSGILQRIKQEIDRVTKRNGIILITGTSNRLWPREVHSRKWFTNYIPRLFDSALLLKKAPQRGIFPWEAYFKGYENLDLLDGSAKYLAAKDMMMDSEVRFNTLKLASRLLNIFHVSVGSVMPSFCLALKKL